MGVRRSFDEALSPRHNSLNFLRLFFAVAVVVSHSTAFGLWKYPLAVNNTTLGAISVYGFFGISGYLIASSALRNRPGRYLWQRFLRIFPAFWACLLVTAFGFGVIAVLTTHHRCHSLSCYFDAKFSPAGYVYKNFLLKINQTSIAGLPTGHYDILLWRVWNGSLWTLVYEFLCYLLLLALVLVGLLRRRTVVLGITGGIFLIIGLGTFVPGWSTQFDPNHYWFLMNLLRFASVFLVGSLVYLYRERIPDSGWLALASGALFFGALWLPSGGHLPQNQFTDGSFFSPAIVYPVLWLGAHLPLQRVGSKNDYSYGVYIYAYPVQQLLAMWGVIRFGFLAFTGLAILITVPLAVCSWWGIEKHALKLKGFEFGRRGASSAGLPVADALGRPEQVLQVAVAPSDARSDA